MSILSYKILSKHNDIAHFCTTRQGGVSVGNYASNNISPFSGDEQENVISNCQKLCDWLEIAPHQLVLPYQNHGTEVREIDEAFVHLSQEAKSVYLNGIDAVYTKLQHYCIGITTADCVPLLFFDPAQKVVAAAHAGWRGTCGKIAQKTIETLSEQYNCQPADILVVIGPSISAEVYTIGQEVVDQFDAASFDISKIVNHRDNTIYLDLWKANQLLLEGSGILPENIEISGICTYTEHERFFSARRLGIKSGRLFSGIMLK